MALDISDFENIDSDEELKKKKVDPFELALEEVAYSQPDSQQAIPEEMGRLEKFSNVVSYPSDVLKSLLQSGTPSVKEVIGMDVTANKGQKPWSQVMAEKGLPSNYGFGELVKYEKGGMKIDPNKEKFSYLPSPAGLAGFGMEVALDPVNLVSGTGALKATTPLLGRLATMSKTAIGRTLSPYIRATELTKEGIDPRILSKRIYDMNLEGKLGNLDELRQVIGGKEKIITQETSAGSLVNKKKDFDSGLVREYRTDLDDTISQISPNVDDIKREQIQAQMWLDNLAEAKNPLSTSTGDDLLKRHELAGNILKVDEVNNASIEDLLALKRSNADYINSKDFINASQLDKNTALEKEVRVDIDRYLKDKIRSMIPEDATVNIRGKTVNARDSFDVSNQMQHHLLQVSKSLETTPLDQFGRSGKMGAAIPAVMGAATGAATAAATGIPIYIGGALGAAGGVKALASKSIQPILAKTYGSMSKSPKIMKSLTTASGLIAPETIQSYGRKPQSIEEVALMKLPRSTEEAIQSPELLIEKVKMLDPNSVPVVMSAINEDPEKLPDIMFALSQNFPHAFDSDKYGRFDGKIPAQTMMQFIGDLRDDKSISNTERAKHMNDALVKKQSHYTPQ